MGSRTWFQSMIGPHLGPMQCWRLQGAVILKGSEVPYFEVHGPVKTYLASIPTVTILGIYALLIGLQRYHSNYPKINSSGPPNKDESSAQAERRIPIPHG